MRTIRRLLIVVLALFGAMVVMGIAAFAFPWIRPFAIVALVALLIPWMVASTWRRIAIRLYVMEVKAANGGTFPIANPARYRARVVAQSATVGGIGVVALATAFFVDGVGRSFLLPFGASLVLFGVLLAVIGVRALRRSVSASVVAPPPDAP